MLNIYLLGVWVFLLVVALALCIYLLECLARAWDAVCNWLEYILYRRKVRRRALARLKRNLYRPGTAGVPHSSPATVVNAPPAKRAAVLEYKARRPVDAREALRRSSSQTDTETDFPPAA